MRSNTLRNCCVFSRWLIGRARRLLNASLENMLHNCHVTVDIVRAEALFGKPKPLCKGKMVIIATTQMKLKKIPLPLPIAKHHQNTSIHIKTFFANRVSFFHIKSVTLNCITTKFLNSRSESKIMGELYIYKNVYTEQCFDIIYV